MANPPAPKRPAPARRKPATRKPAARKTPAKAADKTKASPGALAWSLGGLALAAGAGLVAFLTRGRIAAVVEGAVSPRSESSEGHVPTDLLDPNRNADDRAVADFRPDMDAAMTAAEREALRPATGPAPTLVADRGDLRSEV